MFQGKKSGDYAFRKGIMVMCTQRTKHIKWDNTYVSFKCKCEDVTNSRRRKCTWGGAADHQALFWKKDLNIHLHWINPWWVTVKISMEKSFVKKQFQWNPANTTSNTTNITCSNERQASSWKKKLNSEVFLVEEFKDSSREMPICFLISSG